MYTSSLRLVVDVEPTERGRRYGSVQIADLMLLAVVLALAAWRMVAVTWRPRLRVAAVALGFLLAAGQWALCDFTWQNLPAYLLLAVSALPPARTATRLRWLRRLGFAVVTAAAVGVWILPAVPTLPDPDGGYAVATEVYRWADAARDEPHTSDPTDRRSVIAQAWYPTTGRERPPSAAHLAYVDGTDHMPEKVSVIPGFMLRRYGQVDTHAETQAPLAPSKRPWPLVILSPGYAAPRAVYTGLATGSPAAASSSSRWTTQSRQTRRAGLESSTKLGVRVLDVRSLRSTLVNENGRKAKPSTSRKEVSSQSRNRALGQVPHSLLSAM